MSRARDLLTHAGRLVAAGWTQGFAVTVDPTTGDACYCATGALDRAWLADRRAQMRDLRAAMDALNLAAGADGYAADYDDPSDGFVLTRSRLIRWNDDAARTRAEVTDAFAHAAATLAAPVSP